MRQIVATLLSTLALTTVLTCLNAADTAAGKIWFVTEGTGAAGDGHSWTTPFHSLQDALSAATKGDQIWVARGTYYADSSDATKSFTLIADVSVYGGFAGVETKLEQRDFARNITVLSGNIGKGDKTKNTKTIVMGADRAILDGFTISDAYGTDKPRMHLVPADILKGDMVVGGGMRNFMTAPIVRNCIFKNNYSPKGGAVYNVHKAGTEQAAFINVDFLDNTGEMRGGAVSNDLGAMPRFINCRFIGNKSLDKGGALYNDFAASPLIVNSLFTGNSAITAGGVGNDGGSAPLMINVTITENTANPDLGPDLYQGTGSQNNPILINSVVGSIYSWHEDIVAELDSSVPKKQAITLVEFLPISTLKGALQPADLKDAPKSGIGYQAKLDGEVLLKNGLIEKLMNFYVKNKGAVHYEGEYEPPAITRKTVAASVFYVVPKSSAKAPDGLSWSTAMTDLQAAIELASLSKGEVWIKAGAYYPAKRDKARIAAFTLYDNVKLYGGFAGTESTLKERSTSAQPTILSAKTSDGSYRYPHVLYGANSVLLEGLTIRDGEASGFTYNGKGGGLIAYHAGKTFWPHDPAVGFTLSIENCRFEENSALEGGAIYAYGKAVLSVTNTAFEKNRATYGGAVLDREGSKFTYQQVTFKDNEAVEDGGATFEDYGSHAMFSQARFTGNRAGHQGGAIYEISRASQLGPTEVTVEQSSFADNKAGEGASLYNLDKSTLTIENSDYPGGTVHNP
jgi:predicted outer membrane repeat protein